MFTLPLLDFLQSSAAEHVLNELAATGITDANRLMLMTRLRKSFSVDEAAVLLETARLRQKALTKFGVDAARMIFTADGLEQASDPLIVQHCRATLYAGVTDCCCGIGTDSLGFARQGRQVYGIDRDGVRVAMAQWNSTALALPAHFAVGDVTDMIHSDGTLFFDPARRDEGKRLYHVEQYQPPLSTIQRWTAPEIIVKLSPGVELAELAAYGGEVTFVSVRGELKEALLRVGAGIMPSLRAVMLDGEKRIAYEASEAPDIALTAPRGWLLEPDPAILRAQLVQTIALACQATMLDETIAYLTSDIPPTHPAVRGWRILEWMPFGVKALRAALRERGVGHVTVKKRGTAVTPDSLIPQLKLKGDNSLTLVLTRLKGAQIVILCADQ